MTDNYKIIIKIDEDMEDIIPEYLKNKKADIKLFGEYLNREDFKEIKLLGHSLKGSGGGYGFDVITDIGKNIEDAALKKDRAIIEKELSNLEQYLENIQIEYVVF